MVLDIIPLGFLVFVSTFAVVQGFRRGKVSYVLLGVGFFVLSFVWLLVVFVLAAA